MPELLRTPPLAHVEPVTEVIHGVSVVDPYRWLEDGNSMDTREWLEEQTAFARDYLDGIAGRNDIEHRVRELLDISTYDSLLLTGNRCIFRKRLPGEEQASIYVRQGHGEQDRLLVNPTALGGAYTAVKPLTLSPDGKLLAYEVKEGGERASRVEFVEVETGNRFGEVLPHGHLRALAFAPDSQSFYYSIERVDQLPEHERTVYEHRLGTELDDDRVVFRTDGADSARIGLVSGPTFQVILVQRVLNGLVTDCYLRSHDSNAQPTRLLAGANYVFLPKLQGERILALTDLDAPNLRIVEVRLNGERRAEFHEIVPTRDASIQQWAVVGEHIVVRYLVGTSFKLSVFDSLGNETGEIPVSTHHTVQLIGFCGETQELLLQYESFFESVSIHRYSLVRKESATWSAAAVSLSTEQYGMRQAWYRSKDGTRIPMFLVGRHEVLDGKRNPVILTSYGGFRTSMTPQFSVFVAFLLEKGCVFALPNIRGGGEFGAEWHLAAQRRKRQVAFDDFIAAAEWLIDDGIASAGSIAIFGGSNSGLLVGAALTQRPSLFRAVVCMAPLLDMVRYHLFDGAGKWAPEYGTAEDPNDFAALWRYSPYHRLSDHTAYPAVMMVSGDADQKCNPLHARKMVARLQAASSSLYPIILDYSKHRGHTPVLPLSVRVRALADRMAFLCDQLNLARQERSSRQCDS